MQNRRGPRRRERLRRRARSKNEKAIKRENKLPVSLFLFPFRGPGDPGDIARGKEEGWGETGRGGGANP